MHSRLKKRAKRASKILNWTYGNRGFRGTQRTQKVFPDRSIFIGQKLAKNAKIQMRHFEWFSNTVYCVKLPIGIFSTLGTPTGIYRSKNYHWAWCSHVITLSFSNLKTGHKMYAYTLSIYSAVHLGIYMHWLPSV